MYVVELAEAGSSAHANAVADTVSAPSAEQPTIPAQHIPELTDGTISSSRCEAVEQVAAPSFCSAVPGRHRH
jgi:hypothetical protein